MCPLSTHPGFNFQSFYKPEIWNLLRKMESLNGFLASVNHDDIHDLLLVSNKTREGFFRKNIVGVSFFPELCYTLVLLIRIFSIN